MSAFDKKLTKDEACGAAELTAKKAFEPLETRTFGVREVDMAIPRFKITMSFELCSSSDASTPRPPEGVERGQRWALRSQLVKRSITTSSETMRVSCTSPGR